MKLSPHKKGKRPTIWLQALIAAITLAAVAVAILIGRLTFHETRETAVEQFNRQQLILARSAAAGIESYYYELSKALSSLAKMPDLQQLSPECLKCMQHTYWGFPQRTSIRLLDSNAVLRLIYPLEGWRGELIGKDYSGEAYFQEARKTGRANVSGMTINEQGEMRIRIAVPVHLSYKAKTVRVGETSGVIVVPIDPNKTESDGFQGVLVGSIDPLIIAQDVVSPIVSGKTGYAWLLNEDGIFLAHNEEGFTCRNAFEVRGEKNPEISYEAIERIQRRMLAGKEGVGRYTSGQHRGKRGEIEKLVAFTPVHIDGRIWSVAVCAPVSEVEEVIHTAKRYEQLTLAFVILALTLGGLSLGILSYRWSRSLEREVARQTRELRETGEYLTNLIRYTNAPTIVWNPDRRVTIFNKAFEKMSGWTEAEMRAQPLDVLFPEESRSDSIDKIESALQGKYWETVEIPILCKDGEIRIGLWNSANIYSEDGKTLLATVVQGQDITERKRAEEILRNSEAQKKAILDGITTNIAFVNEKLEILWANKAAALSVNKTPEEMIGHKCHEFWADPEKPCDSCPTVKVFRTRKTEHNTMVTPDGRVWDEIGEPVFDIEGKIIGVVEIALDITKRKRAEERLRLLSTAVEQSSEGIAVSDLEGNLLFINNAVAAMHDYIPEELIGKHLSIFHTDEQIPSVEAANRQIRETGKFSGEISHVRRDGTTFPTMMHNTLTRNKDGTPIGILATLRDITDRKRAELDLMESEKRYRSLFDISPAGIFLLDLKSNIVTVNNRGCVIYGYSRDELLNLAIRDIVPEKISANFPLLVENIRKKKYLFFESRGKKKDGTIFPVELNVNLFHWKGEDFVQVLIQDVTERRRLEEQLRHAQKMEAMGTLAGGIAHDFNNILAGIGGYISLIKNSLEKDSPLTADMGAIERLTWRGADLTKALLAFARRGKYHPEPLNINRLIGDVLQVVERTAGKGIDIKPDLSPAVLNTHADMGQLHQVFMNLFINACEAMPEGGSLTIKTGNAKLDEKFFEIYPNLKKGRYIYVLVSDTGQGMDKETRERIFEPFFTTKTETGTGLGLSIVSGIVERHGGCIKVESEPGEGSTFTLYLPATRP
ncbi:MAG: PAS domain S-box protein [Candidatus Tritonobacter lacicola]|nr:PAS domain S-box protein [Candidatus Tritonobacter lacicola]